MRINIKMYIKICFFNKMVKSTLFGLNTDLYYLKILLLSTHYYIFLYIHFVILYYFLACSVLFNASFALTTLILSCKNLITTK